jgi:rhamnogalacturonyl hydrolase YesR
MAPPFLALMGDCDEAMKQMKGFRKYLFDPEKKLLHHMWDEDKKQYAREAFWGGGNGWTVAGIAKIIRILPDNRNDIRTGLAEYGKELIDGCPKYLRPDGLFHDVIDNPDTFVETNLSQMLAFGIYTGIQSGWLDYSYREMADKMRRGARQKIDANGIVQGACGSPHFDKPGTSVEAQAFFLFMEYALQSLEPAKLETRES